MSKETTIILLGLWVIIMPYLGIYRSWLTILMVLTGLVILVVGFLLRGETISRTPGQGGHKSPHKQPFVESSPAHHEQHDGISSLN